MSGKTVGFTRMQRNGRMRWCRLLLMAGTVASCLTTHSALALAIRKVISRGPAEAEVRRSRDLISAHFCTETIFLETNEGPWLVPRLGLTVGSRTVVGYCFQSGKDVQLSNCIPITDYPASRWVLELSVGTPKLSGSMHVLDCKFCAAGDPVSAIRRESSFIPCSSPSKNAFEELPREHWVRELAILRDRLGPGLDSSACQSMRKIVTRYDAAMVGVSIIRRMEDPSWRSGNVSGHHLELLQKFCGEFEPELALLWVDVRRLRKVLATAGVTGATRD